MTERSVAPRVSVGSAGAHPERLRILLVEDDEGDAFLVRELLSEAEAPFELVVANSLREAERPDARHPVRAARPRACPTPRASTACAGCWPWPAAPRSAC